MPIHRTRNTTAAQSAVQINPAAIAQAAAKYESSVDSLTRKIEKLADIERERLLAAFNAIWSHRGSVTPAEELITSLLFAYGQGSLNPEFLSGAVDQFHENYEETLASCKTFAMNNREAFKALCAEMAAATTA